MARTGTPTTSCTRSGWAWTSAGIVLACAALAGAPARAATPDQAGSTLDLPDGWTRKDQAGGVLLLKPYKRDDGQPGSAIILIATPLPGRLAASWPNSVAAQKLLAAEKPLQHGEDGRWDGGAIRWEVRCCRINDHKFESVHAGVEEAGVAHLFLLLLVEADKDTERAAEATLQALVRSVRATGRPPLGPVPPSGAGGLAGLHTNLRTQLMPNAFGGMDFSVELDTMTFDPGGLFMRDVANGGSVAARCAKDLRGCGVYLVRGDRIELAEQDDAYGRVALSRVPFARKPDGALQIDGNEWDDRPPFPPGSHLDGTWRYQWASSGSMAFSSGSVSVERTLTFTPDGRFRRTGYSGYSGTFETGDTHTGVVAAAPKPADGGSYTLDGYRLVLKADTGETQAMSVFRADPGDGMLVIGGSNYVKVDKKEPP